MLHHFRLPLTLAATSIFVALTLSPAEAHPRRHAHTHAPRVKAVVVVGKPRAVKHTVVVAGRPGATLDLNVKPKATEVWLDGSYRGTVDSFDGFPAKLHVRPGKHRIKFVTPDGVEVSRTVKLKAGTEVNVGLDLR